MSRFNKEKDYTKLKHAVRIANKRIRRIEKTYDSNSWAITRLYDKLKDSELVNGINKRGLIRVNKNMTESQLKYIEKSTKEFMESQTSKLGGIKKAMMETKRTLAGIYGEAEKPLSWRDVNKLYNLVEDKNSRDLVEKMGASNVWETLTITKDDKLTYDQYYDLLKNKTDLNFRTLTQSDRDLIEEIYLKYTNKM